MIDILICDNNPRQTELLRAMVQELAPEPCSVRTCHSAEALRERCAHEPPDIALLDILLGAENGIALAQELFPPGSGTAVIFITGYVEYCADVYAAEHVWFLPKPIERAPLRAALEKAVAACQTERSDFLVTVNRAPRRIDLREVLSIESSYRKLYFTLWNETVVSYGAISELPQAVLSQMIHCHKSFLVNPAYIRTIDGHAFLLTNGMHVPISRNHYESSRRAFLEYCGKKMEVKTP